MPPPVEVTELVLKYYLSCVCSKWRELGAALQVDEQELDKIANGRETELECLLELINSKIVPSRCTWEVIVGALKDIVEADKADEVYHHHIEPCE